MDGRKYYVWNDLFNTLVLKHHGIHDLQPETPAHHESMAQMLYYSTMGEEELKVMWWAGVGGGGGSAGTGGGPRRWAEVGRGRRGSAEGGAEVGGGRRGRRSPAVGAGSQIRSSASRGSQIHAGSRPWCAHAYADFMRIVWQCARAS